MFVLAAALAANAFLSAFGGAWACTEHAPAAGTPAVSHWAIAQAPQSKWAVVRWRYGHDSGTAYVGFLAPETQWTYEDFHADGSFATSTSAGPQGGIWTWNSAITTPQRIIHGAIQWRRDGEMIHQGFGRMIGQSFRETASATCRPER